MILSEMQYHCSQPVTSQNDPEGKYSFRYKSSDTFRKSSTFFDREPHPEEAVGKTWRPESRRQHSFLGTETAPR